MNAPNIVEIFRVNLGDAMGGSSDAYYFISRHTDIEVARKELAHHREENKDDSWVDFCLKAPVE